MDPVDVTGLIKVLTLTFEMFKIIGVPGIVALIFLYPTLITVLWVAHERRCRKHDEQVNKILVMYKDDMKEMRNMYERNVSLVEKYERVVTDLSNMIMLNTQALTRLDERLKGRRQG